MTTALERQPVSARVPSVSRQLGALVRMELLLLRRNMTASVMSVVTPMVIGVVLVSGNYDTDGAVAKTAGVIAMMAVFSVHHHLVTAYAARRQEMVLKRLRAGLPKDATILVGAASSTLLVFLLQAVVLVGYGMVVHDLPLPVNPVTMLLAVLLGSAVLGALAAVLSAVTRSSEAAMLTTLPTVGIFLMSPGVLLPFGTMPPVVEDIAMYLPMSPFTEVLRTSWLGYETGGGADLGLLGTTVAALPWLGVLLAWLAISAWLTKRYFRWEPRHS
jgi:ABC-2 type transport system permease protein